MSSAAEELPEHVRRNRAHWDRWAGEYVTNAERNWRDDVPMWGIWGVPEADVGMFPEDLAGMDAIELGCGTACVSAWLARRGAAPVGIDNSEEQLATARRMQAEHGLEFPLIHGNAEEVADISTHVIQGKGWDMSEQRSTVGSEDLPHEAGLPADAEPPADTPTDESAPDGGARPTVAPRATGWRDELVGSTLVCAVVGIWLIVSPEALGYSPDDASWNPIVCGVLVVVFSIARLVRPEIAKALGLLTFVVGAWLVVSAFLLDAPPGGQLNQAGFGGIVALLSLVGLAGAQRGAELNPR